tara:strand:- start:311 stop:586 length:276 start_codon:yes stop_codon:yes gene_type:complete
MSQEQKVKEVVLFGELDTNTAMKTEGGFVVVINGANDIAPENTFAFKVEVPETEQSQITLQRAFRIFGNTVGLKGVGVVDSPKEEKDAEQV